MTDYVCEAQYDDGPMDFTNIYETLQEALAEVSSFPCQLRKLYWSRNYECYGLEDAQIISHIDELVTI